MKFSLWSNTIFSVNFFEIFFLDENPNSLDRYRLEGMRFISFQKTKWQIEWLIFSLSSNKDQVSFSPQTLFSYIKNQFQTIHISYRYVLNARWNRSQCHKNVPSEFQSHRNIIYRYFSGSLKTSGFLERLKNWQRVHKSGTLDSSDDYGFSF